MPVDQTGAPSLVPKKHPSLAENANRRGQILDFRRDRHWLPEAAEVLAARSTGANMGQLGVFSRHMATVVATIGLSDRLFELAFHFHLPGKFRNQTPFSPRTFLQTRAAGKKRRRFARARRVSVSSTSLQQFVQPAGQPYQFHVALAFPPQSPAPCDPVQVAVEINLFRQLSRVIERRRRSAPGQKPKPCESSRTAAVGMSSRSAAYSRAILNT